MAYIALLNRATLCQIQTIFQTTNALDVH